MNLSISTYELIIERLQTLIQDQAQLLEKQSNQYDDYVNSVQKIKDTLIEKCSEVSKLKQSLKNYQDWERIEDYIKKMGRRSAEGTSAVSSSSERTARYVDPKTNLSWVGLFYSLYPSADEFEYHKKGKAKEAIKGLLRSHDLGFDDNGTIFRQH